MRNPILPLIVLLLISEPNLSMPDIQNHRARPRKYLFNAMVNAQNTFFPYCCGLDFGDKFRVHLTDSGNLTVKGANWHQSGKYPINTCGSLNLQAKDQIENSSLTFNWTLTGVLEDSQDTFMDGNDHDYDGKQFKNNLGSNFTLLGTPLNVVTWQLSMRFKAVFPKYPNAYLVWIDQNLTSYGISEADSAECNGVWLLEMIRSELESDEDLQE